MAESGMWKWDASDTKPFKKPIIIVFELYRELLA
jgi:hypothetical protein